MKKISRIIIILLVFSSVIGAKDIYEGKSAKSQLNTVHPYFSLENINLLDNSDLKIGGMCFNGDTLYVATLSPDRVNKKPDHQGKVIRVKNVISADGKTNKIQLSTVIEGLYEPTAIGIIEGNIYVGTKTQILRFLFLVFKTG